MPLTSTLTAKVSAQHKKTIGTGTGTFPLSLEKTISLATGTGVNQADLLYHAQRTLTASSNEDLDLAGSLTDAFGATLTFTRIKAILISAAAANTNNVVVGGAASNAFINWVSDSTDKIIIRPGGTFALFASDATAYAVTASTADLLRVANSGAGSAVTYDIAIIGASA